MVRMTDSVAGFQAKVNSIPAEVNFYHIWKGYTFDCVRSKMTELFMKQTAMSSLRKLLVTSFWASFH